MILLDWTRQEMQHCLMQAALPPKASRRLMRYFLLGILFDVVLMALGALLPESWLQSEVRNFMIQFRHELIITPPYQCDTA